jgi:CMP-2-keto-3-deoxyoctulosonic acid synthetase
MADYPQQQQQATKAWKHIGLYGHAVGTFAGEYMKNDTQTLDW